MTYKKRAVQKKFSTERLIKLASQRLRFLQECTDEFERLYYANRFAAMAESVTSIHREVRDIRFYVKVLRKRLCK